MEFHIEPQALAKALQKVRPGITTADKSLPILGNVLIEALPATKQAEKPGRLRLTACSLDKSLTVWIPTLTKPEPGATTVNFATLARLVSNWPDKSLPVILHNSNGKGPILQLGDPTLSIKLTTMPTSEYPPRATALPDIDCWFNFDAKQFRQALSQVLPFATNDDTRPVLTCLHVYNTYEKPFEFMIEAADGFKLAQRTIIAQSWGKRAKLQLPKLKEASSLLVNILIPAGALKNMLQLPQEGDTIALAIVQPNSKLPGMAYLQAPGWLMDILLVAGNYPDLGQVIPKETQAWANVSKKQMQQAVKLGLALAGHGRAWFGGSEFICRIKVSQGCINLNMLNADQGTLTCSFMAETGPMPEGIEGITWGINTRYLQQALQQCRSPQAKLELYIPKQDAAKAPNGEIMLTSPISFTEQWDSPDNADKGFWKAVIMPMHVGTESW